MKKFILSALCALGLVASGMTAQAQETFSKGSNALNVGLALPARFTNMTFPPIAVSYERSITDGIFDKGAIGLGADSELYLYRGGYSLFAGGRISAHYEFIPRLDTYLGLSLGVVNSGSFFEFATKGHIGARYLLNDDFGIFGELGTNTFAILRAGITLAL
ncbi:MAG: hypothetical protein Q4A61_00720 [Porphyromonadaceae bacterium]|nr:hypothetical protein [Porphyromonadaceae bacterium]